LCLASFLRVFCDACVCQISNCTGSKIHAANPSNVITGWLEPLLDRIARDNRTVVCPVIDGIADDTFQYKGGSGYQIGGFSWNLQVWNFFNYFHPEIYLTKILFFGNVSILNYM
jgi:hypothetical protein